MNATFIGLFAAGQNAAKLPWSFTGHEGLKSNRLTSRVPFVPFGVWTFTLPQRREAVDQQEQVHDGDYLKSPTKLQTAGSLK